MGDGGQRSGFLRMNEFRDRGHIEGLPEDLAAFPWGLPDPFLGIPAEDTPFDGSPVVILPVPYEATVSYMGGTRFGPRSIIHASRFVELYDHELDMEPYTIGIHTLPELMLSGAGPERALQTLRRCYDALLDHGKFVVMLGGEHSVSGDPILAHASRVPALSVLQLDAHADLRTEYEGTSRSHACVMHRVHEVAGIVPVGIRSLTADERALMRKKNIVATWGHEIEQNTWIERTVERLGQHVYITFDVDYLDPSRMPSTGTPEPGGGSWYPTLALLERVFQERTVVGCDVVELAPIPGLVGPDVLAAELAYKLIAFHGTYGRPDAGNDS
jgi:agmatinase